MKGIVTISIAIYIGLIFNMSTFAFAEVASAADALFELGQQYYEQGNYKDALHELKKALLANPDHVQAFTYIQIIEQELGLSEEEISREEAKEGGSP
ncbi:MAG: tetratricopeptide repeat protein [Omnitrophica bacterium]|nr:tetratricopeptide repeat protein [Candidatus Omnitrophota bacterium]